MRPHQRESVVRAVDPQSVEDLAASADAATPPRVSVKVAARRGGPGLIGAAYAARPALLRWVRRSYCIQNIGQPWGTCSVGETTCHNVGSQVTGYNGGPATAPDGDGGLVKQDVAGFDAYAGYINWWNLGLSPVHWYETSNPALGEVVCKQGITTGSTCGTITASYADISPDAGGKYYNGMFRSDACVQQGDSGGPWARADSETIVGITSHGNYVGSCSQFQSHGEPVWRAKQRFGATIYGY